MYKLYMRCKNYICVEWKWNLILYIYVYTRPSSTNHGRYLLVVIGVKIGWLRMVDWNYLWLKLIDCGWKIPVCGWEIFGWNHIGLVCGNEKNIHAACVRTRCMIPHCQKLRGFKVERGAVLGTVPVSTTLPLCCRNFE